jgi:hypothetical protein
MDNQSAMKIAKNPQFHDWMKHIKVWYHFLCWKVEDEEIELEYTPTAEQVANIITKGLTSDKHLKFTREMGVGRVDWGRVLEE